MYRPEGRRYIKMSHYPIAQTRALKGTMLILNDILASFARSRGQPEP